MRLIKSIDLNRDYELCRKISNQILNQLVKISKKSYTKECVNNQKVHKFVPVLSGNLSVKNAPKLFVKYLEDKICKIKQIQNISALELLDVLFFPFYFQFPDSKDQIKK